MPRDGAEPKPTWQSLPLDIRQHVEERFGAKVVRARRAWGGYGPTPTFRLTLENGQRAFFKGTNAASNEFAKAALASEERAYLELAPLISTWMPVLFENFRFKDWHVLLLEDLGPQSVPPWTPDKLQRVTSELAEFHRATENKELPSWLPDLKELLVSNNWDNVVQNSDNLSRIVALVKEKQEEAYHWLQSALPLFSDLTGRLAELPVPHVLLHGDLRSDNLRLTPKGLRLFDWPAVTVGPVEWELVEFAQSITVEDGIAPEKIVDLYNQSSWINPEALDASIAWYGAFFADRFWLPEIPGLPRLRKFQYEQLKVVLYWATRRFSLAPPDWLLGMFD